MLFYLLFIPMLIIILLIRWFITRKKSIPVTLFTEALRNENSGHYEEAVATYENALDEVKKAKFGNNTGLKNSIIEKLKVLRTAIEYQKSSTYKSSNV